MNLQAGYFFTTQNILTMKLRKPIPQLTRKKLENGDYHYWLHVVTFYPKTNFVANGHFEIEQKLNEQNMFVIDLKVKRDHSLKKMNYLTPVVHTIEVGTTPFGGGEGIFCVRTFTKGDIRDGVPGETILGSGGSDDDDDE